MNGANSFWLNCGKKPYLLVLDGFERVLTAYHRLDKAQIPDDRVDEDLCDCVNPKDGDLLTQLLDCGPSKILISTRLFPTGLKDRGSHKPAKHVAHLHLNGLSPPDALELMRQAGIKGNTDAMLAFADQFGRHSLLLRIVCGAIADYRRKPYDFDAWHTDPIYGGSLKLSEIDLKQRNTHILHFALSGIPELTRKLLSRIAVISENTTYETLSVLNPFLPPRPDEVEEPSNPEDDYRWNWWSDDKKTQASEKYCQAMAAYHIYQEAIRDYYTSAEYKNAVTSFDTALNELENRGLLQWDRDANRYDMHPVVRAYAAETLEDSDRTDTFLKVRDHFASLPPDNLKTATELSHVNQSLEIYRCLVGAGRLDEAATSYCGKLSNTLLFSIGSYSIILELLKPLFGNNLQDKRYLAIASNQGYVLNSLAVAYGYLGREHESLGVLCSALQLDIDIQDWVSIIIGLRNISILFTSLGRWAECAVAVSLARDLAEVTDNEDGITQVILLEMCDAGGQGRYADAAALDSKFSQRPQPDFGYYRPGMVEYWRCRWQFYQGRFIETSWHVGYEIILKHRNLSMQYRMLALRAEWELGESRVDQALESIDQALQITKKIGTPKPDYHDLRAWALARLGRHDDARLELQAGEQRLFAAEAYLVLCEHEQAKECALTAYRWAWGEGPPYIQSYYLQRSLALLKQLGEPEPQLPSFDPSKVPPIPYETEIRAAIARLRAERAARQTSNKK